MPAEVISLLSSPDIIPSRSTAKLTSPLDAKPSHGASRLRYSLDDNFEYDTFDLTADSQSRHISLTKSTTKGSEPIVADPISLLSDDDIPSPRHGRESGDDTEWDAPARKKQRMSPPIERRTGAETFQTWNFNRLNSTGEQSSKPRSTSLNDDPFAGSPPGGKENKRVPSWAKRTTVDEVEAFASSSPGQKDRQATEPAKKDLAWDPISSSGPPPEAERKPFQAHLLQRTQSEVITLDDSDNSMGRGLSDEEDFPELGGLDAAEIRLPKFHSTLPPRGPTKPSQGSRSQSTKPSSKPRAPAVKKTAEERAKDKEEKAAAREAEKERKLKEKERQKEERALEKGKAAALAEVNKIRTDKKVSTPEMIVDLPASLNPTIKLQAEALLKDLDVEASSWHSPVEDVVRWRRKVKSRYNDQLEHWEPIPLRIDTETYAMVIVPAAQFVKLALGEEGINLDSHVLQMQSHFANHTIIYLLEGLTPWLRKNRNLRNRQFVSAVRSGLGEEPSDSQPPSSSQQPRRRKANAAPQQYVDEDTIEDALLQLQVLHGVLIHHTNAPVETAQWIAVFTQHISTVPYRRQREAINAASAGFCMETGQVRTGDGPRDTYLRMLQEIGRITAPIAYGIAGEFASVSSLVRGLEQGGPVTLEGVRKSANKDGAYSDRAVGQAVSRRVYKIFTGRDETSTDI